MDIINKCKQVMQAVRDSVKDFEMDTTDYLSADEQLIVNLFASRNVGDVVSALVEFTQDIRKSLSMSELSEASKHYMDKNSMSNRIEERYGGFGERAQSAFALRAAKMRDDFELELLENGHDSRQSFKLASNSIYKSVNEQIDIMEPAMVDTVEKVLADEPQYENRAALSK